MKYELLFFSVIATFTFQSATAQIQERSWNKKRSAVVLTYDDALNVHLDKVIPALDSRKLKGTFYLIGVSPVVSNRLEDWRKAAKKGHELGNHTLTHPCDGNLSGRSFVTAETDLSKFTLSRAVNEIRIANTLLKAIDGKTKRTFAYPCGDLKIGGSLYYNLLKSEFAGARGVASGLQSPRQVNLENINAFFVNNHTGEQLIEAVKQAEQSGSLLVLLFHGVGGEHSLNISEAEHNKLLNYLKQREADLWIATMVDVAEYINKIQKEIVVR
ncbi:polysaccharide deacetylase family protein [Pedobacter sp. SYSU D00535]|uniref:polysaccharide deacetylase family protein n=1 Tax=Pedobacter sp. SYSU D00535 TaxID=2810308 RepID=UPI001A96F123|nr:polysaccharide deacetylase family protein [Pedobacter sp. SYSU D00535]